MAKNGWRSLWSRDDEDDESLFRDAEQRTGPRPNKDKVFYTDEGDATDSRGKIVRGFDAIVDDERSSDEYGGFGYSGGSTYEYSGSFDDSDDYWYKRNSFRYGRNADYSPSRLFRSTFSSRSWGGSDNEDKNKAIRALRTLTRNANTIVDKSSAKKTEVAVQFSSGADSNGATDNLNEDKQRIVYVSPDELMDTKTTDDEDSVVDALTGFVLLRVQMSQTVAPEVIKELNATGAHNMALRAAFKFRESKKSLAEFEHKPVTKEIADGCLAGVLAKTMLMRLARRDVVTNWGGFAPYFIRHAKKFAAIKETLDASPLSIDVIVGKIAHNLLVDDTPIALPEGIVKIVGEHLGAELAPADLLPACRALVSAVRKELENDPEINPGALESALDEMFEQAKAATGGEDDVEALKEMMNSMLDAIESGHSLSEQAATAKEQRIASANDLQNALRSGGSADSLIKRLEDLIKRIERDGHSFKTTPPAMGTTARYLQDYKHSVKYEMDTRELGLQGLQAFGGKAIQDALEEMRKDLSAPASDSPEDMLQFASRLEALLAKARELSKKRRADLKKQVREDAAKMRENIESLLAKAAEFKKIAQDRKDALNNFDVNAAARNEAEITLTQIINEITHVMGHAERFKTEFDAHEKEGAGARVMTSVSRAHSRMQNVMKRISEELQGIMGYHARYGATEALRALISEGYAGLDGHEAEWREQAIASAMATEKMSDTGFMSHLANEFDEEAMKALQKTIAEDGHANAGADFGADGADMRAMMHEYNSASGKLDITAAQKIGAAMAKAVQAAEEPLQVVDEHLFGKKIENKSRVLTGDAINHVNDEARNDPEEEYIAYINCGDNVKPRVVTRKESQMGRSIKAGLAIAKQILTQHRGTIERIRNALQFQAGKRTEETYGMRSGDLDEGGLHKLSYDCDHIWSQKTISKLPDVAVGILVDQSGSMSSGTKIAQARELCIVLAEALKKIKGVRLYIYGHTANAEGIDVTIFEHSRPGDPDSLAKLGAIDAHLNNYDGYAIKEVAKRLSADPAKKKYLFVIADGLPSGTGYNDTPAIKHVASVCKFVRERLHISTYAFAVGVPDSWKPQFKTQYGNDHVVFVTNVMKCLPQIVRFLRNTLQKEKKLVGVD